MKKIQHLMWDLDGVLFHYSDAFVGNCYNAYGDAAVRMIDVMDKETAIRLAKKSYDETRVPFQVFIDKYGVDRAQFLDAFGDAIDLSPLIANEALKQKMHQANTSHSILTIANEQWALRLTKHLKLDDVFSSANIVAQEKCNDLHKSYSPEPFIIALKNAGITADETVMIEDTQKNLKYAKALGMTTIWTHPKANETREDYVDHVFDTPEEFLDYFIAQRN